MELVSVLRPPGEATMVTQTIDLKYEEKHELGIIETMQLTEYWLDDRGTRYRLVVFANSEQVVVLAGSGVTFGTWAVFSQGRGILTWDYVAEKLALREGDKPGWDALFASVFRTWYHA